METLFEMQAFIKFTALLVTYPIWGKVLRTMWQEIQRGLAKDGGVFGTAELEHGSRPPGEDPFVNIPLAAHRRGRPSAAPSGGTTRAASGTTAGTAGGAAGGTNAGDEQAATEAASRDGKRTPRF